MPRDVGRPPRAVDLLIRDGDVITMDAKGSVIRGGAVAVKGSTIAWIGKATDARRLFRPASPEITPDLVDGLYSELVCLRW